MSIIISPEQEYERAATFMENYNLLPDYTKMHEGGYPRAVFALRRLAENEREKKSGKGKRQGKAKTVKAWVGKRRSKASEIRIASDRIEE